jgi:hypothetical protein
MAIKHAWLNKIGQLGDWVEKLVPPRPVPVQEQMPNSRQQKSRIWKDPAEFVGVPIKAKPPEGNTLGR